MNDTEIVLQGLLSKVREMSSTLDQVAADWAQAEKLHEHQTKACSRVMLSLEDHVADHPSPQCLDAENGEKGSKCPPNKPCLSCRLKQVREEAVQRAVIIGVKIAIETCGEQFATFGVDHSALVQSGQKEEAKQMLCRSEGAVKCMDALHKLENSLKSKLGNVGPWPTIS